ncbi:MAG: hypothetical protein J6A04_05240 [Clostridia bacterium]|nr:hypothetical protein [Clostridia bacterium]
MKISKRKFGILFIFVVFILIETISVATYHTAVLGEKSIKEESMRMQIEQEEVFLKEEEQEVLNLINQYRKENGLNELKPFSKLQEVSKLKGEDLVNNQYFSHTSPNLGTPFEMLQTNGIDYKIAGENLAGNVTAKKAVEAWINSPLHKENILEEKFEYTGICVIESPVYGKIYVQLFIG